jgi:hypothetical protein
MISTIHHSVQVARRDYHCDGCECLFDGRDYKINTHTKFTISEMRAIIKTKNNNFMIKKGEKYIRQFNTDGGDTWTYRSIPEIHEICIKYNIFLDL